MVPLTRTTVLEHSDDTTLSQRVYGVIATLAPMSGLHVPHSGEKTKHSSAANIHLDLH